VLTHSRREFLVDDVEVLASLAHGIGVALQRAQLYDDACRADEELREAASLTAMGMMTSSIVHELVQPISAA
jgi:GAF domain-containing protein